MSKNGFSLVKFVYTNLFITTFYKGKNVLVGKSEEIYTWKGILIWLTRNKNLRSFSFKNVDEHLTELTFEFNKNKVDIYQKDLENIIQNFKLNNILPIEVPHINYDKYTIIEEQIETITSENKSDEIHPNKMCVPVLSLSRTSLGESYIPTKPLNVGVAAKEVICSSCGTLIPYETNGYFICQNCNHIEKKADLEDY